MKKFTSFLIAGLMVFVVSASALQSRVILHSNTNYEVQIDGRAYNGVGTSTITDLPAGAHTVAVYQVVSNGIFGIGKKRNLLSSEQFNLGNNDVTIDVNQNGQVRISQIGYNGNKNNDRTRNGEYNGRADRDNDDYGKSEGKGKGNKYGHYKNKNNNKNKVHHRDRGDDSDDKKRWGNSN